MEQQMAPKASIPQAASRAFLGRELMPLPHESSASALMRLAWRSVLTPEDIRSLCYGHRYGRREDSFFQQQLIDSKRVFAATGWEVPSPDEAGMLGALEPTRDAWLSDCFRFCTICLEGAYHSYWFQFEPLLYCPVHAVPLTTLCPRCARVVGSYR